MTIFTPLGKFKGKGGGLFGALHTSLNWQIYRSVSKNKLKWSHKKKEKVKNKSLILNNFRNQIKFNAHGVDFIDRDHIL